MGNTVNVKKAYEAIADIIGRRENVTITVVEIGRRPVEGDIQKEESA